MDPFAEPLPNDIRFPTSVNSESSASSSAICSGAHIDSIKWRSDIDAFGNGESRKRKFSEDSSYQRNQAPRRIRAHRFPLTKTGYKYLEIGINIAKPSKVEIAIGDTQGREVTLTYEMWKNIIENEDTIYNFLQQNKERVTPHTIRVGHVTLRFGKINNLSILYMETFAVRLALSKETVGNMMNYKFLTKSIYNLLNSEVASVDSKLTIFSTLLNNVKDINTAKVKICNDQSFDRNSKVDGELYARFFAK